MSFKWNSGAIFGGFFGSKPEKNKIQSLMKSIIEPEINRKVGKTIKIDDRTIYPIIEIVAIKNQNHALSSAEIFPIALVVEEQDKNYIISLTENEIDEEEFIKMISPKK